MSAAFHILSYRHASYSQEDMARFWMIVKAGFEAVDANGLSALGADFAKKDSIVETVILC